MRRAPLGKAGRGVDSINIRGDYAPAPSAKLLSDCDRNVSLANSGTIIHPFPRKGVYRSNADTIVPFAAELWGMLHLDQAKAVLQSEGRYGGPRVPLTLADFQRHLAGETSLAIAVLNYRWALFAALDVDELFSEILCVVLAAAQAIGGDELLSAIFCTTGSDSGRGKIVVTFAEPATTRHARKLAQYLYSKVLSSEVAQALRPGALTVYPQQRTGGVVRILGRNVSRSTSLERAFSIWGEPGIDHLRPLKGASLYKIATDLSDSTVGPWAKRLIETPWLRVEGTYKHFGHMVALAREAIRLFGRRQGEFGWKEWLDTIKANSPELSQPSLKTKDRRNVLDHSRERAWALACEKPSSWEPLDLFIRKGIPRGVIRLYNALVLFLRQNGLNPLCFGIDYERIALMIRASKSTAYRLVKRAVELGVLVVHDAGFQHAKGIRGRCTLYGLVCRGQTQTEVHNAGLPIPRVSERRGRDPYAFDGTAS